MVSFEDRQKGFEQKFVHDEELGFKANARRNKLLGLWAAGIMGYNEEQIQAYAKEVVASDFEAAGDEDVLQKVKTDFAKAGIQVTEKDIRVKMDDLYREAIAQLGGQ